jgi:hypothetical protein
VFDHRRLSVPVLVAALQLGASAPARDAPELSVIVARWTAANRTDFDSAPSYSYRETIRNSDGIRTYDVTMLEGSPYQRLLSVGGKPLSEADRQHEDEKLRDERRKRAEESAGERADRIANYQKDRARAGRILEELPRAFQFQLRAARQLRDRRVYVLAAAPRRGYDPPNAEAKVLAGMRGEFWIDSATYQLVHGTARVLKPVSIAGFFARVQPGTEFLVEQQPVDAGIWLPSRFQIRSRSSILFLFHHHVSEERIYFDYRRSAG